ncbi:PREDICTED: RING finger protein 151 [Dipodomys ordii]|uniref:RING finger protein 151 n=1 Tax=Dipodomys ordii TaxID=10020 RepID=A0A1S3ETF7_DIPOR|nr:PREDICTED: RING finger protein 151 [Dipodomys ordii]
MSAHSCSEMQASEPWAAVEPLSSQTMSGGYDLNLFTTPPDCNFLCSVCHGVLKRPVRLPCSHIFCQKCILRWLARQNTCPCCRKEVKRKKMVHVNQLRKTIGRLEVKCKNAEAGCAVTCALAHRKGHEDTCPFELLACPNEGCAARVPRGAASPVWLSAPRAPPGAGSQFRVVPGASQRREEGLGCRPAVPVAGHGGPGPARAPVRRWHAQDAEEQEGICLGEVGAGAGNNMKPSGSAGPQPARRGPASCAAGTAAHIKDGGPGVVTRAVSQSSRIVT